MYLWLACFVAFLCLRARFWVQQPVRHWWNWGRKGIWGAPTTRYCDHAHVKTVKYTTQVDVSKVVEYIQTQSSAYFPDPEHVLAYFGSAYVSTYGDPLEGVIVSRPVNLTLDKQTYRGYYNEFMASRSDAVSRKLIVTHELNRAKDAATPSVFSSPFPLLFVVPIVAYPIYWVQTRLYHKRPSRARLIKATEGNIHEIYLYWKDHPFQFRMVPTISQLVTWIQTKNTAVYYVYDGGVTAMFFFKKTLLLERNCSVLDLCGSIISQPSPAVFNAFSNLMHRVRRACPIVRLHLLSHTWMLHRRPHYKKTECFHYVYRYCPSRVAPKDAFIL
jgi:hypothetical protein